MAEKTLQKFSAPSPRNIRVGPTLQTDNIEFELQPSLINLVQATTFNEKAQEDATTHLQDFLEIGSTIIIKDVAKTSYFLGYSQSPWREKRSSGSMIIKKTLIPGTSVQKAFYQSSSL
jgi:hypothetical protein